MEPSYLNSSSPDHDELEAQCRAHLSAPPIPDNGFSNRVLAALPATGNRTFIVQRRLFCAVGSLAGIAVATIGTAGSGGWSPNLPSLIDVLNGAQAQLFTPPVALALGIAALSLCFAFRDRLRLLHRL